MILELLTTTECEKTNSSEQFPEMFDNLIIQIKLIN